MCQWSYASLRFDSYPIPKCHQEAKYNSIGSDQVGLCVVELSSTVSVVVCSIGGLSVEIYALEWGAVIASNHRGIVFIGSQLGKFCGKLGLVIPPHRLGPGLA